MGAGMRVGWIGAGQMGSQMALRAARAGHDLVIFAQEIARRSELADAGASFAASAQAAVQGAELVCLCLFDDDQARAVMLTPGGAPSPALAAIAPHAVVAIHTSGSAALALDLAAAAPPGVAVIDAPFSGQDGHVESGKLNLLVGGDPAALEAARPVLEAYGRPTHVGPLGSGQEIKLINQFLYRVHREAAEAALSALEAKGVARATAAQALSGCSGASWALAGMGTGAPTAERRAAFQRYFEVYLAAAERDRLDVDVLLRMGDVGEAADAS